MILIIDNYDSFTYNIYHYFGEIGAESNVYRNDKININEIIKLNPKAIVLSPGPCTPNEAGICIEIVKKLHNKFPMYNWQKNKGYPTREHRLAIKKHGISHYHRKSFQPIKSLIHS